MGKFLIVKGASFTINGMPFDNPDPDPSEEDLMSTFQSNMLNIGYGVIYSNGSLNSTATTTRIGCPYTTILSDKTQIRFKLKSGFQIALAAKKTGGDYASTKVDGTLNAHASSWEWVTTTNEVIINLADYDQFGFNVRYSDNSTVFSTNTLSDYFIYIKAVNV